MTKPQIWVAAFLALFLILFLIEKVTVRSDVQVKTTGGGASQMGQSTQPSTAEDLLSSLGCTGCHGSDLTGTKMAPNIHGVKQYWSRDNLINYLRNPSSYMSSARFQNYRTKYQIMMPSFNNIDVKNLGKIADYLLQLQ
ncbi:MAG: c-type cytochrome [Ignavibacteriaceae bacterium]